MKCFLGTDTQMATFGLHCDRAFDNPRTFDAHLELSSCEGTTIAVFNDALPYSNNLNAVANWLLDPHLNGEIA